MPNNLDVPKWATNNVLVAQEVNLLILLFLDNNQYF